MANNCLVTKLKGVVDNDNLIRFGTVKVHIDTTDFDMSIPTNRYMTCRILSGNCPIRTIGGGTFSVLNNGRTAETYSNVSEGVITYGQVGHEDGWFTIVPNAGVYDIEIGAKYGSHFSCGGINDGGNSKSIFSADVSQFNYITNFFTFLTLDGKLSGTYSPKSDSIIAVSIGSVNIETGSLSNVNIDSAAIGRITTLERINLKGMEFEGNITEMCKNKLNLSYVIVSKNSLMSGDILDLANAQVAAGRKSGSLWIEAGLSNVKIDGQPYTDYIISHGGTWFIQINFDPSASGGFTFSYPEI